MKRTLIAAAILSSLTAGAYAGENCTSACDPAALFSATHLFTDIDEAGFIHLHGSVSVSNSSGATVNNTQSANMSGTRMDPPPQDYYKGTVTVSGSDTTSHDISSGIGSRSSASSGSVSASYLAGSFKDTHQSFSAGISASGAAGYVYASDHDRHHDDAHGFGFVAGFVTAQASGHLDTHSSTLSGGFVIAGYDKKNSSSWNWNSYAFSDKGSTTISENVTHYIDTRTPTNMAAGVGNGALAGATGNIGVNIAAGVNNVQSNTVALANMDSGPVLGTAQIFSTQSSSGSGRIGDFNLVASVGDGALAGATGNVGVNVASGLGNVQNNSLALSATKYTPSSRDRDHKSNGGEVIASDQNCQTADATVMGGFTGSASLGAGALVGATGNIGVNIASGAGNLQHNGLAIASVSK